MNLRNNKGISKVLLPLVIIILAILTCSLVYITNNNKAKEAEKFEQDSSKKEISQTNNSLNNLFMFGSDTSLTLVEDSTKTVNKQDTLVINNDGTIIDKTSLDGFGARTEEDQALTKSSNSIDETLTLIYKIKIAIKDNGFQK